MRIAVLIAFLFGIASAVPAESIASGIVTVPASQCVWRAGDDPSWAAANLDESAWQPNPHWQGLSPAAHIWVRCHSNLSSLQNEKQPALQVTLYGAYQLFVNGELLGGNGDVHSGVFGLNVIRQYPLNPTTLDKAPVTIAFRIGYHVFGQLTLTAALNMDPPILRAGDLGALTAQRAKVVLSDSSSQLPSSAVDAFVGVLGLTLLGLFYYDRGRLDLLYLSLLCLLSAAIRINAFSMALQLDYSSSLRFAINQATNLILAPLSVLFFFALARRRVPRLYWVPIAIIMAQFSLTLMTVLLPAEQALAFFSWLRNAAGTTLLPMISWLLTSTAPFVAFWPYRRITGRMRPIAALCLLWGAANFVWFAAEITNNPRLGIPNFFRLWEFQLIEIRSAIAACVLIALLVLLFRDQRQVTEERALLAGEIQAASEIQRMLAPVKIDTAPGLKIGVAFHPMREVGGDFYLCRVLQDGRQRVLVGDVSGKGAAAAMAATLLIGAAGRRDTDLPAELLCHLNLVLCDSRVGGFATCLCADIAADGTVTMANAGHLSPYCGGDELKTESALPLGVAPEANYTESTLILSPGDTLTFISDGVVEAQSPTGELFGFDRAAMISAEPAESIARSALSFGQEDDITVLTLTFAPAEVLHV